MTTYRVLLLALLARAKHCDGMRPRPSFCRCWSLVAGWLTGTSTSTVGVKNALCTRRFRLTVRPPTSSWVFFFSLSFVPSFLRQLCDFDALALLSTFFSSSLLLFFSRSCFRFFFPRRLFPFFERSCFARLLISGFSALRVGLCVSLVVLNEGGGLTVDHGSVSFFAACQTELVGHGGDTYRQSS